MKNTVCQNILRCNFLLRSIRSAARRRLKEMPEGKRPNIDFEQLQSDSKDWLRYWREGLRLRRDDGQLPDGTAVCLDGDGHDQQQPGTNRTPLRPSYQGLLLVRPGVFQRIQPSLRSHCIFRAGNRLIHAC